MTRIRTIVLTIVDDMGKDNEALWAILAVLAASILMEVYI